MQVVYITNFIKAASDIFHEFFGEEKLSVGEPTLRGEHHDIRGFAVIIGLTGDVEGRVVLDMDPQTALHLANLVNNSELSSPHDELVQATIQEMSNMIAGRAITLLNDLSCVFDITPPALVLGKEMMLSDIGHEIVSIAIDTRLGTVGMTLVIYENDSYL